MTRVEAIREAGQRLAGLTLDEANRLAELYMRVGMRREHEIIMQAMFDYINEVARMERKLWDCRKSI